MKYRSECFVGILVLLLPIAALLSEAQIVSPLQGESLSPKESQQAELMRAIHAGDVRTLDLLLREGINLNYVWDKETTTPLNEAIARRQPKIIDMLLEHGADVNFGSEKGIVPLCTAAWLGDYVTVEKLLKRGAQVEARDAEGNTALLLAPVTRGVRVIELLLSAGADPKAKDRGLGTTLMAAAMYANADAVKIFLKQGVDPCARNRIGETAADQANTLLNPVEGRQIESLLRRKCKE